MQNPSSLPCFLGAIAVLGALSGACTSQDDDSSFEGGSGNASPGSPGGQTGGNGDDSFGGDAVGGPPSGGGADTACASVISEANTERRPADIIIAVDTSLSMFAEIAEVQQNLNRFASLILESGVDVHVVLVAHEIICIPAPLGSGACFGADTRLPVFQHVNANVGSHDALKVLLDTYPQYKASLRPEATKTFAVVTDDNSRMTSGEFTVRMLATDPAMIPEFKFDAIASASFCSGIAAGIGTVYQELVNLTQGKFGDLCLQDFDPVFNDMATQILSGTKLSCAYDIPAAPDGSMFSPGKVNVHYTPSTGAPQGFGFLTGGAAACGDLTTAWYYDDPVSPKKIALCPRTCDVVENDSTGKIAIQFGCETVTAVPR